VLGALVLGYAALAMAGTLAAIRPALAMPAHALGAAVFTAVPLLALYRIGPGLWRTLLRRPRLKDVFWVIAFLVLTLVVVFGAAAVMSAFAPVVPNKVVDVDLSGPDATTWLAVWISIQLVGEELVTILPLLAVMQFSYARHRSRRRALLWGWVISSLVFALLHLPAYQWNLLQVVMVILPLRMALSVPYLVTRNLWVSYAVHLAYDAILLTLAIAVRSM
jgi:hypothetical protein